MTYMLCPICREKVIGGGIEELSQTFKEHLRSYHGMHELCPPDTGKTVRPVYEAHDKNAVGTEWSRPGEPTALVPDRQEVTDFAVRCPFCGKTVTGRSESDLGEQVRDHWSDIHDLGVRSRNLLSPSRGGRRGR
jgi:predicted small metal-binding protein